MIPCSLAIPTRIYPILNVQSLQLSNPAAIPERLVHHILSFERRFTHAPQSPFLHIDLTKSERR